MYKYLSLFVILTVCGLMFFYVLLPSVLMFQEVVR